jgi:hypothetical protein
MKMAGLMVAAIIGGIASAIAGLIGDGFFIGLFPGVIAGGIVGFLLSLAPRSFEDPLTSVESFSPAGFVGRLAGSVASNAGWLGGFLSCGAG